MNFVRRHSIGISIILGVVLIFGIAPILKLPALISIYDYSGKDQIANSLNGLVTPCISVFGVILLIWTLSETRRNNLVNIRNGNFVTTWGIINDIENKLSTIEFNGNVFTFKSLAIHNLSNLLTYEEKNVSFWVDYCKSLSIIHLELIQLKIIVEDLNINYENYSNFHKTLIDSRIIKFWLRELKDVALIFPLKLNADVLDLSKSLSNSIEIDPNNPRNVIERLNKEISVHQNYIQIYCSNSKFYRP